MSSIQAGLLVDEIEVIVVRLAEGGHAGVVDNVYIGLSLLKLDCALDRKRLI